MLTEFVCVIAVFILICFTGLTLYLAAIHRKFDHLPGPPRQSFYFGNFTAYQAAVKKGNPSKLLLQWAEEYGPCYRLYIIHIGFVIAISPTIIKEVLTKSIYTKPILMYKNFQSVFGARCFGTGLFSETNYEKWHKRRSIVGAAFNKKYLKGYMDQFNDLADILLNTLTSVADGQSLVSMREYLTRIALDAIADIGFDNRLDAISGGSDSVYAAVMRCIFDGIACQAENMFNTVRPSKAAYRQEVRDAVKVMRDKGHHLISERKELMRTGSCELNDLLSHIIKYQEMTPGVTDEDLVDDYLTLFIAGQDTTANALSFLFLEVGRHPEVLARMVKEVDEILQGRSYVTFDDLGRLEYMSQVIKETLRLYAPGTMTGREIKADLNIDGFDIPANTCMLFPTYVIHHYKEHYENADDFQPDRFESTQPKHLFTYLPFAMGPRSCVGKQFALIESKVLLCKFLQRFTFDLDPNQSFDLDEKIILRPASGVMMSLSLRT